MAKVFISFVQDDNAVAQAVKEMIESSFDTSRSGGVFLSSDRFTLRHGENWMDRVKKELMECSVLVSLLSKRSIERRWISFEAGAAWVADKLLPVYFGNLTVANIPRPYSDLIAVDLLNNPFGLIQGVDDLLGRAAWKETKGRLPKATIPPFFHEESAEAMSLRETLEAYVDID